MSDGNSESGKNCAGRVSSLPESRSLERRGSVGDMVFKVFEAGTVLCLYSLEPGLGLGAHENWFEMMIGILSVCVYVSNGA